PRRERRLCGKGGEEPSRPVALFRRVVVREEESTAPLLHRDAYLPRLFLSIRHVRGDRVALRPGEPSQAVEALRERALPLRTLGVGALEEHGHERAIEAEVA